jgi:hypothetical protein
MLSHGLNDLLNRLSIRWWIGVAEPSEISSSVDRPKCDMGSRRATFLVQKKQERDGVGEHYNLSFETLNGDTLRDRFSVHMVERGNRVIEYNARTAARRRKLGKKGSERDAAVLALA